MDGILTHGSLFAGIGGFELAASEANIQTLWNCEIEPYPRLVLAARFHNVIQYGDIRKLDGGAVAPVDIVTFGSPCQSFSHAGSRAGLNGASGLFHEAVRVIKEMRNATNGAHPRYAIMENVPGIYSSKSGGKSDFREVLNELLKIADETIHVPEPAKGKFLTAGAIVGDGYSLAWRTLCASKFGVAQRRRRMFLVVSFADERAAEMLSEPQGKGRDFTPRYRKGQGAARGVATCVGGVESGNVDLCVEVKAEAAQTVYNICSDASNSMRSDNPTSGVYEAETARTLDGNGGSPACSQGGTAICLEGNGQRPSHKGGGIKEDEAFTLNTVERHAVCYQEMVGTLCSSDYKGIRNHRDIGEDKAVVETFGNNGYGSWNGEVAALKASGGDFPGGENLAVENRYAVRRLTVTECLRLQGFPDDWFDEIHITEPTDDQLSYWRSAWAELGKTKSDNQLRKWLKDPYGDSNAYRAIGNSLAVPCALWVLRGVVEHCVQ
ncbi:MAG: DNA cytosine methyltransferase [Oscillospiraceae bacterium]|jgi:DNA (cytosine-5)-methyltransferase 1|nr:DNA cytosine methyltransferase [Oscillospiraceae bacterium]